MKAGWAQLCSATSFPVALSQTLMAPSLPQEATNFPSPKAAKSRMTSECAFWIFRTHLSPRHQRKTPSACAVTKVSGPTAAMDQHGPSALASFKAKLLAGFHSAVQSLALPSQDAEAATNGAHWGGKAVNLQTFPSCAISKPCGAPLRQFQTETKLSLPPERRQASLGQKARELMKLSCKAGNSWQLKSSRFQSLMLPSRPAVAKVSSFK